MWSFYRSLLLHYDTQEVCTSANVSIYYKNTYLRFYGKSEEGVTKKGYWQHFHKQLRATFIYLISLKLITCISHCAKLECSIRSFNFMIVPIMFALFAHRRFLISFVYALLLLPAHSCDFKLKWECSALHEIVWPIIFDSLHSLPAPRDRAVSRRLLLSKEQFL